mmetsp:Transcript_12187/g.15932  ORF Transcript_12187/g.15932 Transcript_12187/m.15932 type:complete len:458 (+) Transcript_12187:116-1489(+)|eukprot:CAMPEP_0198144292 /NCGR_PEP_ID=MMETSP1443-20131203/14353_1 /TAXON_ID=186043 /ORGANISM="Entomoneis sp., Strain CCMP2396" /LENGTH=457 /DNA_ID=CAMNT_0043807655 /DNA_START=37 /DNA_END=1410 /DNA_ORIENTATION=-
MVQLRSIFGLSRFTILFFPYFWGTTVVLAKFQSVEDAADNLLNTATATATCEADGSCGVNVNAIEASSEEEASECVDVHNCIEFGEKACKIFFDDMSKNCRKFCHFCDNKSSNSVRNVYSEDDQKITGTEAAEMWEYNEKVDDYMYNTVYSDPKFVSVREDCLNRNELCLYWGSAGECTANPNYMKMQCAPTCFSCDNVSFDMRCPYDSSAPTVWSKPGELQAMFQRIVTEPEFQQYQPTVLSRPNAIENGVLDGPWVVYLDNFLTAEECQMLIDLGTVQEYERSRDIGDKKFDGTYDGKESTGRTSSNAWCVEDCWEHETTQRVHDRIQNLIEFPMGNYEYLQILKYEEGEFYEQHHDYIFHHKQRFPGVRVLTVFLYLNDVEEGGGTNFPFLNQTTVLPKRGRVLIWPSVLDSDPNGKDRRTEHEALPVISGIKYGANAWIHQRDFKEVWAKGCH